MILATMIKRLGWVCRRGTGIAFLMAFCAAGCWAGIGGSVSGTVRDASGAVVGQAEVMAINLDSGVRQNTKSDGRGVYSFPVLSVGRYDVEVSGPGFKPYRRTGVMVDANSVLVIDAVLQVGQRSDAVTVSDSTVHVETYSSQMGEVINSDQMNAVPLDG